MTTTKQQVEELTKALSALEARYDDIEGGLDDARNLLSMTTYLWVPRHPNCVVVSKALPGTCGCLQCKINKFLRRGFLPKATP